MALWELEEFRAPAFLGFVRNVPDPNTFLGTRWLPDQTINDTSFEYFLGANRRPVMAHIMGFDSEAPLHGRPGRSAKIQGELPPIKRKSKIGEKDILRFLTPRAGTPDQLEAVRQVYITAGDLIDTIKARAEWLRIQALSEDTVLYDEAGVVFQFDFGITPELQIKLGASKSTDGNGKDISREVGGPLNDPAKADPVKLLQYVNSKLRDASGRRFAEFVASEEIAQWLPVNLAMKRYARGENAANVGADSAMLTPSEVSQVMNLYGLPDFVAYDVIVQQETERGDYADVRPLAKNKAFLVPPAFSGQNKTLWGPTAESRVLYGTTHQEQAPGIWAETYGTTEPPAEWVKAAAIAFPSIPEANQIAQIELFPSVVGGA